jgi:dephospho-CoA kinase
MIHPSEIRPHVFVLAGLPGSGKSTAGEFIVRGLAESYNEPAEEYEMSDFVREAYVREHDGDCTDNELGDWAERVKRQEGQDYFAEQLARHAKADETGHVVISGVRSPEEAVAIESVFGIENTSIMAIWTMPAIRFERKYGSSPSVEHPEWDTFVERNNREKHEWGCLDFFVEDGPADYVIPNHDSLGVFRDRVSSVARQAREDDGLLATMFEKAPFHDRDRADQYV